MDKSLYKGIFWFKDLDDFESNITYFKILCDNDGNIISLDFDINLLGKSGNTLNHKKLWETLPSSITENKSFDYFPRGRVEISKGKATIFITQYLTDYQDEVIKFVKDKFGLTSDSGIKEIKVIVDGSDHYKPKMDS